MKGSLLDGGLYDCYKAQNVVFKTRNCEEIRVSKWSEVKQELIDNGVQVAKSRDVLREVYSYTVVLMQGAKNGLSCYRLIQQLPANVPKSFKVQEVV